MERVDRLADGAVRDIERLQDFQAFSGHSYDRYSKMVEAGHLEESVSNTRTRTTVSAAELARTLLGYLDDDLPRVVLYEAVAHYEAFFFSFLKSLLLINARALRLKRKITVEAVLDAGSYEELVTQLIEHQLHDLQYKRVHEWFEFLSRVLKLAGLPGEDIDRLAELKATRDIHLHNAGIANERYAEKAGTLARVGAGEPLPVSRPYVYEGADFLKDFVRRKARAARDRLTNDA